MSFAAFLALAMLVQGEAHGRATQLADALASAASGPCYDALTANSIDLHDDLSVPEWTARLFEKHALTEVSQEVRERHWRSPSYRTIPQWPIVGAMKVGDVEVMIALNVHGECAVAVPIADEAEIPAIDAMTAAMKRTGWLANAVASQAGYVPTGISVSRKYNDSISILAGSKRYAYPSLQYRITFGVNGVTY